MNQKLIALLLGVCAVGAVETHAQAPAPATVAAPAPALPSWTVTATPAYVSTYMFRGVRLGGQSFQPAVEADEGNAAIGVWSSFPANHAAKVAGQSDPEIDPYGTYTFPVTSDFSVEPGFTWYTYPKAPTNQGFFRETFEPNVALNYTVYGVKLQPKFYDDVVQRTQTYEFNLTYTVPLKSVGSELDFTGTDGTYHGTNGVNVPSGTQKFKTWGDYWLAGVSAPIQINKASKLVVGWAYTKGSDSDIKQGFHAKIPNPAAVGRGVLSLSYAWTF
jgi:uncharacterized protein (TIGR02001 family)